MKQKLTLTLAAMLLGMLVATAANPLKPQMQSWASASANGNVQSSSKIHFNEKCMRNAPMGMATQNAPRRAATIGANGEIRQPGGQGYDYLYSYWLMDAWGESYLAGRHVKIYYDDSDKTVYLQDFMDDYMGDCYYVGGHLIEGDLQNGVMEFETREAVYYSYGEWLMLIVAFYDEGTGEFYVKEDEDTFKLNIKDGVISNYTTYLALASITNDTDVYWLQAKMCYDPIDLETAHAVQVPSTATLNHYYQTVNESDESIANIYREGNDFYFNNIFGESLTFKGTLQADNKIAVELPQLVKADDEFVYVNTYYEVNNTYYKPGDGETVYFDYDPKSGDIYYEGDAAITLFSGNKFLYLSYDDPYGIIDLVKFTEDEEPTIVPSTASVSLYSMSTGYDEQGNHKGGLMKIAREGNTVYFLRVDNTNYDVVMKGELDPSTNKVTVSLSQLVGVANNTFLGLSRAKQSIVTVEDYYADDYNEIRYVVDSEGPSTLTIDYDPETGIYQCNDVFAVIDAQRNSVAVSLIKPTYAPVDEVATVPADAETSQYVFSKDGDVSSSTVVKVARKGNDFYFVHPSPASQVGEVTIHGVLNDEGKVEIAVPQLVANGSKDQGVFLRVGSAYRDSTPEGVDVQERFWRVFDDDDVNSICINYDEGLHEFDYDGYFSFVQFSDNNELLKAEAPYYKTYVVGIYEPAAPTDLELVGKSEDYWGNFQRYRLDFVIPCNDVDGKYLPYDNLYFRIYFDNEVFVFTPEEYPLTFIDDITEVPFNHPASSEIPHPIWNSNMRQVYFYGLPKEKIGVQSCYKYNGQTKYSAITYLDLKEAGMTNILGEEPVKVEYFDTWGRKVNGTDAGLVIVKKTYRNGQVVTEKIMID